jgi:hypothetical protein
VKQLTAEWFEIRAGKVTASKVYDVISKTKSGDYAAGRAKYQLQLVTERSSKQITSAYVTPAMQWGIDREPEARVRYQSRYEMVDEVGFVAHPIIPNSGASKPCSARIFPKAPRSSAKLIDSGEVPRIVTPFAFNPAANPSGVCPPSWVITPSTGPA